MPAGGLLIILAGDFVYYWCHRFQHRFLWRWHATHHSPRELSVVTCYHHLSELPAELLLHSLPMAVLMGDPYAYPIIGVVTIWQGYYLHSPMRLNAGPLWAILQDNRLHRIHHSIHPEHHDKNFGVVTTLWDVMFGTAYFPRPDEWPATGVEGFPEPMSPITYALGPVLYRPSR